MFDDEAEITTDPELATEIYIQEFENDVPKGFCAICYPNAKLLGFGKYLKDTASVEGGTFM